MIVCTQGVCNWETVIATFADMEEMRAAVQSGSLSRYSWVHEFPDDADIIVGSTLTQSRCCG